MRKYLVAFFVAVFLFIPLATQADVLPDGMHGVNNTFILDNISAYPGYNIYLTFPQSKYPGAQHISQMTTQLQFSGPAQLIAVKKENQSSIKSGTQADCPECGDNWYALDANKSLIIKSNLSLNFDTFLPDTNPIKKVTKTAHIDSLNDTVMTARLVSGQDNVKPNNNLTPNVQPSNNPAPTDNTQNNTVNPVVVQTTSSVTTLLIVALIVCLGIIGILIAQSAWKK